MVARKALLKYLRVDIQLSGGGGAAVAQLSNLTRIRVGQLTQLLRHHFCEEARRSFFDKPEVTHRVVTAINNFQKFDPFRVNPNAYFQNDLGLDSLDTVEIVMALEKEFGFEIPNNEADNINSINLAVDFIASHPQAK